MNPIMTNTQKTSQLNNFSNDNPDDNDLDRWEIIEKTTENFTEAQELPELGQRKEIRITRLDHATALGYLQQSTQFPSIRNTTPLPRVNSERTSNLSTQVGVTSIKIEAPIIQQKIQPPPSYLHRACVQIQQCFSKCFSRSQNKGTEHQ